MALRNRHRAKGMCLSVCHPSPGELDPAALDDTIERVNISLPRRVLVRLDSLAREAGDTRSGFIARMALKSQVPEAQVPS